MALMIACVEEAKRTNDEFLTREIMGDDNAHADKRMKADDKQLERNDSCLR